MVRGNAYNDFRLSKEVLKEEMMQKRQTLPALTRDSKLIVVMRAKDASQYVKVIDTLLAEGIRSFELTQTTPGTLDMLPQLVERYGAEAELGIGTVTTIDEVDRAARNGAAYLVTPVTNAAVIERAIAREVPIIPGGLTPTELFESWNLGTAAVKIFPANQVGPSYLKDLRGPFPDVLGIPSGGVDIEATRQWLAAGAPAVSVGGPLVGDAFRGGEMSQLAERARKFVSAVSEVAGL